MGTGVTQRSCSPTNRSRRVPAARPVVPEREAPRATGRMNNLILRAAATPSLDSRKGSEAGFRRAVLTQSRNSNSNCWCSVQGLCLPETRRPLWGGESRRLVGMTKRSTVSTARLKALLPLHPRPINLVVYQGSFVLRPASLILRGASRLDAFSGYPCRT